MEQPGLVERIDHLTAAVADLAFKLDTLTSSTTAFRESFGDRMTDYADLVAHWSIETEQNLATQRRTTERVLGELRQAIAERDEAVTRLTTLVEGLAEAMGKAERRTVEAVEAVGADMRRVADDKPLKALRTELTKQIAGIREALVDEPSSDDALAAVLAEVAEVRKELPTGDLHELAEEVRGLRREMARLPDGEAALGQVAADVRELRTLLAEADVEDVEDEVSFAAALGEQLAAMREELAALRTRVDAKPPVPDEVLALTAELQALRAELENEPESVEGAPALAEPDHRLQETLAELVFEVRALRRRFPVRAADAPAEAAAEATVAADPAAAPPVTAPKRRRRSAD
ncbi:MAG: hypothetical protein KY443_08275 [Actinobacteria bacterium]|nr:hypothetical protein [Actinomycetota bacterium]